MPPQKSHSKRKTTDPKHLHLTNKKKNKYFFKKFVPINTTEKPIEKQKNILKHPKNCARLPTKPDEASSNWKMLSTQIKPVHTKGRLLYLEKRKKEAQLAEKLAKAEQKVDTTPQGLIKSENKNTELDVWFDDVDPILLDTQSKIGQDEVKIEINGQSKE